MQRLELWLPLIRDLQVNIHAIRKLTMVAKHCRFDVDSSEKRRHHSDRFFSLCLALQAVGAQGKDFYQRWMDKQQQQEKGVPPQRKQRPPRARSPEEVLAGMRRRKYI